MADTLLFIDTNIFLDFYRQRSREGGLAILERVDEHHDVLVTGDQVQMEFKKNRQRVILEAYIAMKGVEWGGLTPPLFLAESKTYKGIQTGRKRVDELAKRLKSRLSKVLQSPTRNDPVYRVAQRLFCNKGPLNLSRDKEIRFEVRESATKRFQLGYPPRKNADTSIGDAINWEWIVRCAKERTASVVIVTRDTDYGAMFDGKPIVNDWLREEFRARVSRKRTVQLTDRLSEAFKAVAIRVTKEEEAAEEAFLSASKQQSEQAGRRFTFTTINSTDPSTYWIDDDANLRPLAIPADA